MASDKNSLTVAKKAKLFSLMWRNVQNFIKAFWPTVIRKQRTSWRKYGTTIVHLRLPRWVPTFLFRLVWDRIAFISTEWCTTQRALLLVKIYRTQEMLIFTLWIRLRRQTSDCTTRQMQAASDGLGDDCIGYYPSRSKSLRAFVQINAPSLWRRTVEFRMCDGTICATLKSGLDHRDKLTR